MATLHTITAELNAKSKEEGGAGFFGDFAGQFDISDEQAERIAEKSENAAEFVRIWENETWWL